MNEVSKLIDRSIIEVVLDSTVTTIGQFAFANCTSLTSIDIPSSVTSIRSGAFQGCTALTSVTVNATNPPNLATNSFNSTNSSFVVYVPASSLESYKTASNWKTYADRIQAIPN